MSKLPSYCIVLLAILLSPFFTGKALAGESLHPANPEIYTFHTALQSPIKEILEGRIKEAFRRLGLKAEVQVSSSAQRALFLANEEGDGDAGRVTRIKSIAPKNTGNLIQVPEPIMNLVLTVYTKDKSFPVTGWQSLQNYHNGARIGAKILEKNIPGKRTFMPTTLQLVRMLDSGRIDTMVEWNLIADHAIKELGVKIKKLSPPILVQPFHLYLHKKYQHLVPKLNSILRQMKEEGAFDQTCTDFVFYTGAQSPMKELLEKRLQEAFRRAGGFSLKLINPGSAQRALVLANEDGDGDANRVLNIKELHPENTENLLIIPEPLNTASFRVYTNGTVTAIKDYNSLSPFRNGFRVGVKILETNVPGTRIMLPDATRLLQMLNDGRLDTVIEWPSIADRIIQENNYTNITKGTTTLIHLDLYAYIHRKHYSLVPKITQALREMKEQGSFAPSPIENKHHTNP